MTTNTIILHSFVTCVDQILTPSEIVQSCNLIYIYKIEFPIVIIWKSPIYIVGMPSFFHFELKVLLANCGVPDQTTRHALFVNYLGVYGLRCTIKAKCCLVIKRSLHLPN